MTKFILYRFWLAPGLDLSGQPKPLIEQPAYQETFNPLRCHTLMIRLNRYRLERYFVA